MLTFYSLILNLFELSTGKIVKRILNRINEEVERNEPDKYDIDMFSFITYFHRFLEHRATFFYCLIKILLVLNYGADEKKNYFSCQNRIENRENYEK